VPWFLPFSHQAGIVAFALLEEGREGRQAAGTHGIPWLANGCSSPPFFSRVLMPR